MNYISYGEVKLKETVGNNKKPAFPQIRISRKSRQ